MIESFEMKLLFFDRLYDDECEQFVATILHLLMYHSRDACDLIRFISQFWSKIFKGVWEGEGWLQ